MLNLCKTDRVGVHLLTMLKYRHTAHALLVLLNEVKKAIHFFLVKILRMKGSSEKLDEKQRVNFDT